MSQQIDEMLRQYHGQFHRDHDRLRDQLAASLLSQEIAATPRTNRLAQSWIFRSVIGMAASLALGVLVCYLMFSSPQTLYARAMRAIKKAGSVHIIAKGLQDGQWLKTAEVWYDAAHGVCERKQMKGEIEIRIDNGTYQWSHISGREVAIRSQSTDPMGLVAEVFPSEGIMDRLRREPAGDRLIASLPCRLFTYTNEQGTSRSNSWIDAENRLHRYEEQSLHDGQWVETELIEVHYEVAIDPRLFEPDFGKNVRMVEAENLFDELFSLDRTLYKKEDMGLIVAIHELKPVEGNMVYFVYSTRPSQETNRRLGPLKSKVNGRHLNGSIACGDMTYYIPAKRVGEDKWRSYQPVTLASCHNDGMQVEWVLLLRRGEWPAKVDDFEFGGNLHTRMALAEERQKAGLPTYKQYRPMVTLPLPKESLSLSDVIAKTHGETSRLEPSVFQLDLYRGLQKLADQEVQQLVNSGVPEQEARRQSRARTARPSRLSPAAWEAEVRAWIEDTQARARER